MLALSPAARAESAKAGKPAPDFELPALKGGKLKLSSLRGKVVLLDFFASWCEPCKKELPELARMHRELQARGFSVLAVNLDEERDDAEEVARDLPFPVALDPKGDSARVYDLPKMPSSYVIDRAGVVRRVQSGFRPEDVAPLRKAVEETLGATAAK